MVARIGAQIASLSFAAAIAVGLIAGNTPTTVLRRALLVFVGALVIGQAIAWVMELVLQDYLRSRKAAVDRAHLQARPQPANVESSPAGPARTGNAE